MTVSENVSGTSNEGFFFEWIEQKRHFILRQGDRTLAYIKNYCGKRWDVFDAGYRTLFEIEADNPQSACNVVMDKVADGSLQQAINNRNAVASRNADIKINLLQRLHEQQECDRNRDAELFPRASAFDEFLRPAIPMTLENHRLLRAVATKRASKIPGETPSIGAVVAELIDRFRADLEREGGAQYKKELAKKK